MNIFLKVGDITDNFGIIAEKLSFWGEVKKYCFAKYWTVRYKIIKAYQTLRYGFPDDQVYDLYSGVIQYTLPRLKKFNYKLNSHPNDLTFEEWQTVINKIIWSMEHNDDSISPIYPDNYDHRNIVTGVIEHAIKFDKIDKRSVDFSPIKLHGEKVQEGFELFGKYFTHLWD